MSANNIKSIVKDRAMLTLAASICMVSACGNLSLPFGNSATDDSSLPQTIAAHASGRTYVPVDPLNVSDKRTPCPGWGQILNALPDNAVRMAITDVSGDGKMFIGGSSIGVKGRSYRIVIDYIMADTTYQEMEIAKFTLLSDGKPDWLPLYDPIVTNPFYEVRSRGLMDEILAGMLKELCSNKSVFKNCQSIQQRIARNKNAELINIPVYVGVGIRITANLKVQSRKVSLAGLGAIGVAASAGQLSGDLVIQTLGITGSKVATLLPLPSELNPTTIQNAIVAMASIKSALFSTENDIIVSPQIVGFYDPLGIASQQYINAVVSNLGNIGQLGKLDWTPSCPSL